MNILYPGRRSAYWSHPNTSNFRTSNYTVSTIKTIVNVDPGHCQLTMMLVIHNIIVALLNVITPEMTSLYRQVKTIYYAYIDSVFCDWA